MSNLNTPARIWLAEQFEFERCAECGGDACHHTAVPFLGNWFARCDFPADEATGELHPDVRAYLAAEESTDAPQA